MNVASQKRSEEFGLWGRFDGTSGFRQSWNMLGLPVCCHIASEVERTAIRVTSSRWPDAEQVGDITDLDSKNILGLRQTYPKIKYLLRTGGFPCQDLSSVNTNGKGLQGGERGLFYIMMEQTDEAKLEISGFCGQSRFGCVRQWPLSAGDQGFFGL